MNKFVAIAAFCLVASVCIDAASLFGDDFGFGGRRSGGRGFGGFGGFDGGFGNSIFGNDFFRDSDRGFFRSSNRVKDVSVLQPSNDWS